jgi:hypothetical protein
MTVWIVGSLNYHNDTIVKPIIAELKKRGVNHCWLEVSDYVADGANVHVEDQTENTINYWEETSDIVGLPQTVGEGKFCLSDGDSVLVLDFWNPMIFQLKFYVTRKKFDVKFFSIHHGSSHLPGDFASGPEFKWAKKFESAWIDCYTKIFFGSKNAYGMMPKDMTNGVVTYLPIDYIRETQAHVICGIRNEDWVVMPLRLDADKGAAEFFEVVERNPEFTFHCSRFHSNVNIPVRSNLIVHDEMNRVELFELMSGCKYVLSCAKQETFGYGVLEAVSMGCEPVLIYSDENCYTEMYNQYFFKDPSLLSFKALSDTIPIGAFLKEGLFKVSAQEKIVKEMLYP